MNPLTCLIVDDEPVARKILREFAQKTGFLALSGEAESASQAAAFLRNTQVDLIFLDIEMPKLSGLEWLHLSSVRPMVIITTAFKEYALDGYEMSVIDYLLKPFSYERFLQACQRAKEYAELKTTAPVKTQSWIFVRSDKKIERLEWNQILFVEGMGNYVRIHKEGGMMISYLTLKGIASQLPPDHFVKIHQSYLINFSRVQSIEGNTITIGGHQLPVGRNYKEQVMALVEKNMLKRS